MNGLSTFLLSASSMAVLAFTILWFQSKKKKSGLIEEKKHIEKILSSSNLSWKKVGTVKDIIYYPLKSGKGKSIDQCEFSLQGISKKESGCFVMRDRLFLVYNEETKKFQTARQYGKLILVSISAVDETHAKLEVENMPTLVFKLPKSSDTSVKVTMCYGEVIECLDCGSEASEWFSKCLTGGESNLRLGMGVSDAHRDVTSGACWKGFAKLYTAMRNDDTGVFSDLASYMLISEASANELNTRLNKSVAPLQLRPNVIIKDCEPYAEDQWEWIKIGSQVVIHYFKQCTRCSMVRVDPETGIPDAQNEPLKTLRTYRKLKNKEMDKLEGYSPAIGIYCGLYRTGEVKVGDDVYVYQPQNPVN